MDDSIVCKHCSKHLGLRNVEKIAQMVNDAKAVQPVVEE